VNKAYRSCERGRTTSVVSQLRHAIVNSTPGPHFNYVPWSPMNFVFQYISLSIIHVIHRLSECPGEAINSPGMPRPN